MHIIYVYIIHYTYVGIYTFVHCKTIIFKRLNRKINYNNSDFD